MSNRTRLAGAAILGLFACGLTQPAAALGAKAFLKTVNADADKTISKDELDAFAKKRFAALESDRDNTLDAKELKGRLSQAGLIIADLDKDKSIDEGEFIGYANKLFDAANTNSDTTLSVKELETPAGKKLIKLLE